MVDESLKAIDLGYVTFVVYRNLAAAYGLEGKIEEAKAAVADARRLNPKLTVKLVIAHAINIPALIDGLRKAGLPEE